MFSIMEYVWKIRGQLKKDATNYEQIFKLLGDTENRMWNKIRRIQLQVKRCQYAKREVRDMSSATRRRGRREVKMETIIGFLLIIIIPILAAAVAAILIRRHWRIN